MNKYERYACFIIMAIGAFVIAYSYTILKLGSIHSPDAGFVPFLYGAVLILIDFIWFIGNLHVKEKEEPFWVKNSLFKPSMALIIMLMYSWSMETLGYILANLLFLMVWELLLEREKIVKALIISVLGALSLYIIFGYLLNATLPAGIFSL